MLALDQYGELVSGVSTSGYPWKYPGRVGDSSLPGAGTYSDARYGAAACTGRGELAMRVTGAREVVDYLARGDEPDDACQQMLRHAAELADPFRTELRTLCLTPDGRHGAAASQRGATYNVIDVATGVLQTRSRVALV